jgi:hypothetical protein
MLLRRVHAPVPLQVGTIAQPRHRPEQNLSCYDLLQFVVFAKEDDISVRLPSLKGNTDAPM